MNSFWIESIKKIQDSGTLEKDANADVCIIGAGICGITTAYYLIKRGYKVIVIDKDEIANKVTGHTTAKITSQHGLIYHYLEKEYGVKFAKKYFEANEDAIKNIRNIIQENSIDCDFQEVDSYIYTCDEKEVEKINQEADSLKSININSTKTNESDLPFNILEAVKFKNQAQFNPLKYIKGLVNYILKNGGKIYTKTLCTDVKRKNDEYTTYANGHKIHSKYVVLASQYPFLKVPGLYFTKMYQSLSYVIALETNSKLPNGMYLNVESPTYSFRTANNNGKEILLLGGADHKTGDKVDYEKTYGILEKKAKEIYPDCKILYKWSTRDAITLDKIPYIGEYSNLLPNMYIGTGFNKWGMTSSNVAANIIADKIEGKFNAYEEVFKSTRLKPITNKGEMKNMIVDSTKSLIINKLKEDSLQIKDITNNSGGIVEFDGEKVGIYKNEEGKIYCVKPICTHLGCLLEWNDADKTWDCPCHGSRFNRYGKNIYGPAIKDLDILV